MNELRVFNNNEFGPVRTLMIDGKPWMVGKDIAKALGFAEAQKAVITHVDEEDRGVSVLDTPGGKQNMVIINESGLYSLIFSSRLDSAKRFKHWVTGEILPELRRTGQYGITAVKSAYDRKATSVGEVVDLVCIQQKAMERRGCSQQDISEMMAETLGQFGIPVPGCFLAAPGWKNAGSSPESDYKRLLQILLEELEDMQTKPVNGGTAIPVHDFNNFCSRHSIRAGKFKKWLRKNGLIECSSRTDNAGVDYTVPVRMGKKTVRCVVLLLN